jgi:glycine betaine/proline transport system substrate-binding protein
VGWYRSSTHKAGRGRLLLAALLLFSLLLAACADDGADDDAGEDGEPAATGGSIEIGLIPWDEAIAVTNLWQLLLEDRGYEVSQTDLEVGALYSGVAEGDLDLFLDAWLPATHEDYWDQFGDQIEDLGTWFGEAPLTWTVPAYVDEVNSIADLQGNADMFDGQVVGIEPGSGLMRISGETVMPTYGLEGEYELVESSTPAMLAELERAINNEEPVLVTLWEPHYAYGQWDLKNLEDPEGALGEPDGIHSIARPGFGEDFPEVATWLQNFQIDGQSLAELEVSINEAGDGNELEGARTWLEDNRDVVEPWFD